MNSVTTHLIVLAATICLGVSFASAQPESARQLREQLLKDPFRPTYHIVAPEGLCAPFDGNGGLFLKGRYHFMYIIQNQKGHCWAHISSTDLVHWRIHPNALEPGDGDSGIFSGGAALDKNGTPTITYWGLGKPGGVCIATSTDDNLDRWTKSPANPVIRETQLGLTMAKTPDGKDTPVGAADPSAIWIKNGKYYVLTGNLLVLNEYWRKRKIPEHQGDTLYLFSSDDLVKWTYLHPFYTSDRKWTRESEDNMCPDFFPLPASPDGGKASDKHMILFISHNLGCQYYLGRYDNDRFDPQVHGRMTWVDNHFFAPESLVDSRGRRIMWSWVFDGRTGAAKLASGWSGTMSLPRLLWLNQDGQLGIKPPEELRVLRTNPRAVENVAVPADGEVVLDKIAGNTLEIEVEIQPRGASKFGLKVCRSPGGEEQTLVYHDVAEQALKVDVRKASLGEGLKNIESGPLPLKQGQSLLLRVFVDKSMVEAFANDRQAVVRTIYPTRPDSLGVSLFSQGGAARVKSLKAYDMAPANPW
jgi:beta-fructofuranosidase